MKWESKMLPMILIIAAGVIGISAAIITHKSDSPIEQGAEEVIEYELEQELRLPPESLKGRIDLSPWEEEKEV
jgi:hypothetical protein